MDIELIKVEKGSYTFNFEPQLAEKAEEIFSFLEEKSDYICNNYFLKVPYMCNFYLFEDNFSYEKFKSKQTIDTNSVLIVFNWLKSSSAFLYLLKELGILIFNSLSAERISNIRDCRNPYWINEGYAQNLLFETSDEHKDWLLAGWNILQEQVKNKGIIPFSIIEKNINYIPNRERRQIAEIQSFYMVCLLNKLSGKKIIKDYSELMRNNLTKVSSQAFQEVSNITLEQFYGMFKICLENNAALI